ncbi:hypothetical protein RD792_007116 [Penstemon davidsonii]|uniref:Uncharacterized protein n=1 Tax=Penstemon davidsonii TaxID=160366 RepID=A0ABR0D5R6_9LAMI|nr:hypothetical protein RD792_007116 [Penstemon davidsonii]
MLTWDHLLILKTALNIGGGSPAHIGFHTCVECSRETSCRDLLDVLGWVGLQNCMSFGLFGWGALAIGCGLARIFVLAIVCYLMNHDMFDGGNMVLHEIDDLVVTLKLQGACGSRSS